MSGCNVCKNNTFALDNQQEIQGLKSALGNVERQNTELKSALNNVEKQIEELKSDFKNVQSDTKRNESSVYTIHYTLKNWMDSDLSCKAEGGHLVSFEIVDEQNHVAGLIQWRYPRNWGLGDDNWIWRNRGEMVLEVLEIVVTHIEAVRI